MLYERSNKVIVTPNLGFDQNNSKTRKASFPIQLNQKVNDPYNGRFLEMSQKHVKDVFCTWQDVHFLNAPKSNTFNFSLFEIWSRVFFLEMPLFTIRKWRILEKNVDAVTWKIHPSHVFGAFQRTSHSSAWPKVNSNKAFLVLNDSSKINWNSLWS